MFPFSYATGAKLKLLQSLAEGVPFLTTTEVVSQIDELLYPCLVSNDRHAWLGRILEIRRDGITKDAQLAMKGYANKNSWSAVARSIYQLLASIANDTPDAQTRTASLSHSR